MAKIGRLCVWRGVCSGTLEFDELAETWRALSGKDLGAETLSAIGAEPGDSLTFRQFQRLLREQLPHVVDLLATVNSELVAKGKRGLNKREIAELLSRVGPRLVSILEAGHSAMPRALAAREGTFCASDLDEVAARASSEFHVEIHSLASQLAALVSAEAAAGDALRAATAELPCRAERRQQYHHRQQHHHHHHQQQQHQRQQQRVSEVRY